jgi:hypothetical protein
MKIWFDRAHWEYIKQDLFQDRALVMFPMYFVFFTILWLYCWRIGKKHEKEEKGKGMGNDKAKQTGFQPGGLR